MNTEPKRRGGSLRALAAACAAWVWAGVAAAQVGGPATASDTDGTCTWTSTIHASSEVSPADCVQMTNGLNAQDFNMGGGWNVNFAGMLSAGALVIDQYYAWVSDEPTVTCGGVNFPGTASGRIGGAVFCLEYTPGAGDPSGSDVHWVQAIRTDCPSAFGMTNGVDVGGGFFDYLDNGLNGAPGLDPFYDTNGAAGSTYFLDIPFRSCEDDCMNTCTWDACVFLATGSAATQNLTLYGVGYEWGFTFECVPEPAAAVLLGLGAIVACRRRRSRSQAEDPCEGAGASRVRDGC